MRKTNFPGTGRSRVVIQALRPEVDFGRYPIKRTAGETVEVEADIFADGHDVISAVVKHRREDTRSWMETPLRLTRNDVWTAEFSVPETGRYIYTACAWIDPSKTWLRDFEKRVKAGQDLRIDAQIGAELFERAATGTRGEASQRSTLKAWADKLRGAGAPGTLWEDEALLAALEACGERRFITEYSQELAVTVDRERARYSAWYEFFPRSTSPTEGQHGTFKDAEAMLPYIAKMGFNIVYLPPIHPIGKSFRKGPNNSEQAGPGDPGSPWAIGSDIGGHKAVHPELGTLADFRRFREAAESLGLEVALDIAFQAAPDHPYVKEHRSWFRARPDGSIQYAENPPKKYQDIYPFDFESEDWTGMWDELKSVFEVWIKEGVKIFRVDNPHTKPFMFWEWVITELKRDHPDVLFLSEAFTRPKIMYRLAKLGFTQSYNYFPWRNGKHELIEYFTELSTAPVREFFRPNLWPNTPDILTEYLQFGGRPAFIARFILAATLGASYGIYGPAFELCYAVPRSPGSEEYLGSEKYQLVRHRLDDPKSLREVIARVNTIRAQNPALHQDRSLRFHTTDNEQLLCYSKTSPDGANIIVVVVNLDPHHMHSGWVTLDLELLSVDESSKFQMHDLLTDARYLWQGPRNYVELRPDVVPAHIFCLRKRIRSETDFEYFL